MSVNSSMAHEFADPVVFSLKLNGLSKTVTRPRCVWWDYKALNNKGNWAETGMICLHCVVCVCVSVVYLCHVDLVDLGCITLSSSLSRTGYAYINCSCSHLTNFAVLVDIQRFDTDTDNDSKPIDKEHERALHYITMTFGPLSMISLGITIFLILTIKV